MSKVAATPIDSLQVDASMLKAAWEEVKIGVLIADRFCRIVYANGEMRKIFKHLARQLGRHPRLSDFLKPHLCGSEGADGAPKLAFAREGDDVDLPLIVKAATVRCDPPVDTVFVVTVIALNSVSRQALSRFVELHGLTRTEGRLLDKIYAGLSSTEIAASERISVNTVRSHLKSIMAKTGHNRHSMLVRELAAFARLCPTEDMACPAAGPDRETFVRG